MEWIKIESDNYIFNYHVGSIAEKDIEEIIDIQETCYDFICNCLTIKMGTKIKYYLCESSIEVGKLYGDNEPCNGFARKPNEIYAVYNKKVKCVGFHEDAHIISYNISMPPQTFIREGLAMCFDKVSLGIPNYSWVKFFIDNDLYANIEDLVIDENFYKYSYLITYPIAGAFVDYLISLFGIDKFKLFYCSLKEEDFKVNFFEIFNITLSNANRKFIKYINSIGNNNAISNIIKGELEERNILKLIK
ncbi:hypothetical protein KTC92_06620 [Clostridium sp. CM027]|uniref:hypothetical protein n=1 Tax=Clostridium sp. CM027 TaxID=2849865 RepID=UPI001C6EEB17|nr:hypothetical protein [Clostridium sp. CM027]MBW9145820.1 hypothetical protein [Clostridium sp. CM027]UVE42116.1 hypothetical protein KTC92_06620 [Clostridium sp. CM027]